MTEPQPSPTLRLELRYGDSCATLEVALLVETPRATAADQDFQERGKALSTYKNNVSVKYSDAHAPTGASPANPRGVRPWTPWQDWINVVLGVYLAFAPLWTAGAPAGWFVTLGILAIAVGLWAAGTASSRAAEWTQIVLGAVVFLAPWLGGFAAAAGAAWTAWIVGVALIVFAAMGMTMNNSDADTTTSGARA